MAGIPNYLGARPSDWVNGKKPPKECYLILNLEGSKQPGSHWLAVCNKPDNSSIEYFDSFGLPPEDNVLAYMKRSGKPVFVNRHEIQNYHSEACGDYCVNYLRQRYAGKSPADIIDSFRAGWPDSPVTMGNDQTLWQEMHGGKLLPSKKMVRVSVFDGKGLPISEGEVAMTKPQIKKVLQSLPKGRKRIHVRLGKEQSHSTHDISPKAIDEIKHSPHASASSVTPLLHLLPGSTSAAASGDHHHHHMHGSGSDGDNALSFFNNLVNQGFGWANNSMGAAASVLPSVLSMFGGDVDSDTDDDTGSGLHHHAHHKGHHHAAGHHKHHAHHHGGAMGDHDTVSKQLIDSRMEEALAHKVAKSHAKDKSHIELTDLQKERIRREVRSVMRQTEASDGKTFTTHDGEKVKLPARDADADMIAAVNKELSGGPKAKKPLTEYQEYVRDWMVEIGKAHGHMSREHRNDAMKVLGHGWTSGASQSEIEDELSHLHL